ncbi:MAG: hypothetical protein KBS35_02310 [Mycoplasma sp.]|nr:hypothetical protein [Candidatus Hennigella equi]
MKIGKSLLTLAGLSGLAVTSLSAVGCSNVDNQYFTVTNNKNLEVTFCDTGASIYSIYYKGTCVTYQPEDKQEFTTTSKNSGKILGRTSGRIAQGKMNIDGKDYQFSTNEGKNTIHGGKKGLSSRKWKHQVKDSNQGKQIIFTYLSPDKESGYPDKVEFNITYTLFNDSDKIRIDMLATPSTNNKTPICLSGHTYWRLGGEMSKGIREHELKIPASNLANSNKVDQIIEEGDKKITATENTEFDFRNFKQIGQDIDKVAQDDKVAAGYDHGWRFDDPAHENIVELQNKETNIHLSVRTDIDMVFIYANCHPIKDSVIKHYGIDQQYGGVSIEPMVYFYRDHYDSILHTHDNPFKNYIEYELDNNIAE